MMKNKVLNYINENKMIEAGDTVVIGVSGGADSMCLLHMLMNLREKLSFKLLVVHIHHGIRGESALRDAEFVEEFCKRNHITVYVKEYDVPALADEWGMSMEEAGRKVRYDGFRQALASENAVRGKIAVAHNGDDVAETVLFNLFRGSGIKGLMGIKPVRDEIIRPLLCLKRSEIEDYNREHNIDYVTDETNLTTDYTRNKLRLSIIPQIVADINEQAVYHINETARDMALANDYMEMMARQVYYATVKEDISKEGEIELFIKYEEFNNQHEAIKYQVIKNCLYKIAGQAKDITRVHMESVFKLFFMEVGKSVNLPYCMIAKKQYDGVLVKQEKKLLKKHCQGEVDKHINAKLAISKDEFCQCIFEENKYTKWIDCDIMENGLQLRTRMPGDYIVVDAKGSKKKLKDYFIDKKIPREERDNVLLVANGSDIVWIVGYRLSEAYKVNENSKNIYRINIVMEDT